jgi:hypothetical protein
MKIRRLLFTFSAFMMIMTLSSCFLTKKKCDCPKFGLEKRSNTNEAVTVSRDMPLATCYLLLGSSQQPKASGSFQPEVSSK